MTIKMLSKQECKGLGVQVLLWDSCRWAIQKQRYLYEGSDKWEMYSQAARDVANVPQESLVEDIRCFGKEVQVTFREVK